MYIRYVTPTARADISLSSQSGLAVGLRDRRQTLEGQGVDHCASLLISWSETTGLFSNLNNGSSGRGKVPTWYCEPGNVYVLLCLNR